MFLYLFEHHPADIHQQKIGAVDAIVYFCQTTICVYYDEIEDDYFLASSTGIRSLLGRQSLISGKGG